MTHHGAPPVLPAPLPVASLAGSAQLGGSGGSGMVERWNALQRSYENAQALTDDTGRHVVVSPAQFMPDLPPDSVYADRALYGGVRTRSAFGQFIDEVFTGGHSMLTNRPALAVIEVDTMAPQEWAVPAEWRDAPPALDLCRRGAENTPGGFSGKGAVS